MKNLGRVLKSKDITLPTDPYSQSYIFSNSYVWMRELDHKEGWLLKNWCFWTVVLDKILESSLHCKEIKPVNPKGDQPWIFIGRTDVEAEAPTLCPPNAESWLIGSFWCCERLRPRGNRDDRGWSCSMASQTQWAWVWANSRRWCRIDEPGVLQSMALQTVRHGLETEQQPQQHNNSTEFMRKEMEAHYWRVLILHMKWRNITWR